jgi:hypothetical protein
MTKLLDKNGWRYHGIEVPENAVEIMLKGRCVSYFSMRFSDWYDIWLPENIDWQIVCDLNPTEEQAAEVVEAYIYSGRTSYNAYKNYSKHTPESEDDILISPLESLDSLKKSKGLKHCIILKKKI